VTSIAEFSDCCCRVIINTVPHGATTDLAGTSGAVPSDGTSKEPKNVTQT
jgi:hypothetical protein